MNELIQPTTVLDDTRRHSFSEPSEIAGDSADQIIPPAVRPFRDVGKSKVKVMISEYVSSQPERAALAAMAAGAALTGVFRYLIRRKKSGHPERRTR